MEILTPTEGVNFREYISRMLMRVKQEWYTAMPNSVYLGAKGMATVLLNIRRDGTIENAFLETSSKNPDLDQAAMKGIQNAGPFAPLPDAFKGPHIELRFTFYYNIPIGSGSAASPSSPSLRPPADCAAQANITSQPPFDRLELVAFASGATSPPYAAEVICQRGINFLPDIGFRDALARNGIATEIIAALPAVKQLPAVAPSGGRDAALEELDAALKHKSKGDSNAVNDSYARAVKLAPDSASLRMAYANRLIAMQMGGEAEVQARRSVELWPTDAEAHVALGSALTLLERNDEAASEYQEALRIFPEHKIATLRLKQP